MDTLAHEKEIIEYLKSIDRLKQGSDPSLFAADIKRLEKKVEELKKRIYSKLTAWERIQICRHPGRPHSIHYIENLCESFTELAGDRTYRDDPAIIGGLAKINGMKCVVIGQEKGHNTETRLQRNFGMLNPEGFRKALRLMKLAEKFHLPVVSFIDTKGANPCLEAEERGQAWAIAHNLREMACLQTPIIVIVIGEGCSGGALGMGIGDVIGMLEHAYYSVISPEGCASILWKDVSKKIEAASALKLNAEHLELFGIIDSIIKEPPGGAHHHPEAMYEAVELFILKHWEILKRIPPHILIEQRYEKFRNIGLQKQQVENSQKIPHLNQKITRIPIPSER